MSLFRAWTIYRICSYAVLSMYLLGLYLSAEWLMFSALGLLLAAAVFALITCRCPNCGHFLLRHIHFWKKPAYCPACGESLDW